MDARVVCPIDVICELDEEADTEYFAEHQEAPSS